MSGKVVNLRAARKARTRDAKRAEADANAARHGRTKAQKAEEDAAAHRARRHLDGHERE
ncbi:DUF4169 family protein [Jannaschia aquimarina]|uniref:DUF4169 domain-containing protein n=1 Tax=Jannaschia aquimarina TaxID=935700 RepID=A0A0D1EE27_9RHOB|nr:DUF4169 family protein [Jannaschia aquimarina]KIT15939.1 hypothetical protein jaqu_22070 [Jannaschia aquimarina]SNS98269.1 protein of unknown function [Jannaschia aquimarina]